MNQKTTKIHTHSTENGPKIAQKGFENIPIDVENGLPLRCHDWPRKMLFASLSQ